MTGPEHFKTAEDLLAEANRIAQLTQVEPRMGHRWADLMAEAQVHATLALAAATVEAAKLPTMRTVLDPSSEDGERLVGNPWHQAVVAS